MGAQGESAPPPLTYEDTKKILAKLGDVRVVLVGGQAVNFWASYFLSRLPSLAQHGPYASKDIDFAGGHDAVQESARRLGGHAKLATLDDMNTPNTGMVVFVDEDGYTRGIDFLSAPGGLTTAEVFDTSFPATITTDGVEVTFRVMHPLLSLESRAHNVAYLPGYQTDHALGQLRAAILCARESVRDALDEGATHVGTRANERIFKLAAWRAGLVGYTNHGIDVFQAAIEQHPSLPKLFMSRRYPQMRQTIDRKRRHCARVAAMEDGRRIAADAKAARAKAPTSQVSTSCSRAVE